MTEHQIRLRGGWTCRAAGALDRVERRLNLPAQWHPDGGGRYLLTRAFGRPPVNRDRETLWLRMERVEGILALELNGRSIGPVSRGTSRYEIELPSLLERNVLVMEIEVPEPGREPAGAGALWGVIALVVRTVEAADEP